jgi:hypothetical protein
MASDVAPLPREPDILIGMIAELRDENDKLRDHHRRRDNRRELGRGSGFGRYQGRPAEYSLRRKSCARLSFDRRLRKRRQGIDLSVDAGR